MTAPAAAPEEVLINSVGELLQDLIIRFADDQVVWFRGHSNASYKLQCSLARRGGLDMEHELISQFRRDATALLPGADFKGGELSDWDWLFVMQHYGVPTRLLDWSESPLAAMFFALGGHDSVAVGVDAAVWALLPQELNLAARITSAHPWDIPLCGASKEADRYSPAGVATPGRDDLAPAALTGVRRFDRIRAQTGVFTVMHRDSRPLEETSPTTLIKYVIPHAARPQIVRELQRLGVHAAAMYPDLQHLAIRVADRLPR